MTASPTTLQHALTESLSSGIFIDTKIYGFSTRKSDDRVGGLKALYANSHVLKQVPYFDALLSGGFSEGNTTNIRSDDEVLLLNRNVSWCGYSSDSDLEDDVLDNIIITVDHTKSPTDEASSVGLSSLPPKKTKRNKNKRGKKTDHSNTPQIYHPVESTDKSADKAQDGESIETKTRQSLKQQSSASQPVHLGKVVIIKDAAFATLQALVMYLYTGEIKFAPFGSEKHRKLRKSKASTHYQKMPKSSPKSIYRLADQYGMPDLKNLAYLHICANLSKCNIVEEYFSRFTSHYTEILDAEVQYFANILQAGSNTTISANLDKKIEIYAKGELPHASEAFNALFNVLWDENNDLELGPVGAATPKQVASNISPSKNILKTALNKSMTTG